MERAADWLGGGGSLDAGLEDSERIQGNVAPNFLADLLERWRSHLDVVDSVKARRSNFPHHPAALLAGYRSSCAIHR